MSQQWQEVPNWSNNAIIKIFETEYDFNEYICSLTTCKSIWISIDATNSYNNHKGGEYKFHSIMNNLPAYRNANNDYLAHDGYDEWYIMSEDKFVNDVTGGWFRIASTGSMKTFISLKKNFNRKKSNLVIATMARSRSVRLEY